MFVGPTVCEYTVRIVQYTCRGGSLFSQGQMLPLNVFLSVMNAFLKDGFLCSLHKKKEIDSLENRCGK